MRVAWCIKQLRGQHNVSINIFWVSSWHPSWLLVLLKSLSSRVKWLLTVVFSHVSLIFLPCSFCCVSRVTPFSGLREMGWARGTLPSHHDSMNVLVCVTLDCVQWWGCVLACDCVGRHPITPSACEDGGVGLLRRRATGSLLDVPASTPVKTWCLVY